MVSKNIQFETAIAVEFKRWRIFRCWTMNHLAVIARDEYDLKWTQPIVASIESCKRQLTPSEFALLPHIFGVHPSMFFDPNQTLKLTRLVSMDPCTFEITKSKRTLSDSERILSSSQNAAERQAAASIGVDAVHFSAMCFEVFGRTMTEEREFRFSNLGIPDGSRRAQAMRGVISRQLIKDIKKVFKSSGC